MADKTYYIHPNDFYKNMKVLLQWKFQRIVKIVAPANNEVTISILTSGPVKTSQLHVYSFKEVYQVQLKEKDEKDNYYWNTTISTNSMKDLKKSVDRLNKWNGTFYKIEE